LNAKYRGLRDLEGESYDATNLTAGWSKPGALGWLMTEILPNGFGTTMRMDLLLSACCMDLFREYAGAMENGSKCVAWHGVFKQHLAWVIKRHTVHQKIKSILFCQLARKLKASFPPTPPVRTRKSSQATAAGLAQSKHELDASSREEAIPT